MASFSKFLACSSLVLSLLLISCSSSSKPPADFSLAASPSTLTLMPGAAPQQVSVTATASNGFNTPVTVSVAGLPNGVTANPTSLTLTPGAAQNIALSASTSAAGGATTITLTGTSGMLSHTAAVMATVAPPPDFNLTVAPSSLSLTAGAASGTINVTANPLNSFSGQVSVAITGLPTGVTANPATLTLTPGTSSSTTLTAALTAVGGTSTLTFTGTSGALSHSSPVVLTVQAAMSTKIPDVTTFHYDLSRSGLNSSETILNQSNVNSSTFGKLNMLNMDGHVDAQPLYLSNVPIGGQQHNVLYAGTEHGTLYAFDADNGTQLWSMSTLGPGETPSDNHNCTQITPEIGISATPVIDRTKGTNGTIFVVATSKDSSGGYHHRLHALDLTTGAEIGTPTEVTATFPGTGDNAQNGNVVFDPAQYAERAALLLLNGTLYTGWTSHCDAGLYNTWLMTYDETTLQQKQILNLTPNGHEGSIWMSGAGLAADASNNVYVAIANGPFDTQLDGNGFPSQGDYGNALIRFSTANNKLTIADYFEMFNGPSESSQDLDLGSGGVLLLPDQTDANGGVHHLVVAAGKDKNIYLADRDNLGKFNTASDPTDNSNVYQELPNANAGLVYSSPAYFNGTLYYASDSDTLRAYPLQNAKMATSPSSSSPTKFGHPGPTPTITFDGTNNNTGIVWALDSATTAPAILHAYDPANLGHELYNSTQAANNRDGFGMGNKFIVPMVVNGKVYVGTPTGVAVFGLLPH